jgi:hypothetical protein
MARVIESRSDRRLRLCFHRFWNEKNRAHEEKRVTHSLLKPAARRPAHHDAVWGRHFSHFRRNIVRENYSLMMPPSRHDGRRRLAPTLRRPCNRRTRLYRKSPARTSILRIELGRVDARTLSGAAAGRDDRWTGRSMPVNDTRRDDEHGALPLPYPCGPGRHRSLGRAGPASVDAGLHQFWQCGPPEAAIAACTPCRGPGAGEISGPEGTAHVARGNLCGSARDRSCHCRL